MPRSSLVRQLLPLTTRQMLKHRWRRLQDIRHGITFDSSRGNVPTASPMHLPIQILQPIRRSNFYDNKIINITRGAALLHNSCIRPAHNWSFWHLVGRPDAANGFVAGRNLVDGKLVAQTGGGLCQLSSLVYHLALMAGLTIKERHAHSIDIYEEEARYTPLGSDATVVWGFKDLRLYNPHPFPVAFSFVVSNGELVGGVYSESPLIPKQVEFVRKSLVAPFVKVETVVDNLLHTTTTYEQQQGLKAPVKGRSH